VKKSHIISEIARTAAANGERPLGLARFETETGITYTDWFGIYWAKWGDAVSDAGFLPNKLNAAFDDEWLLGKYAGLAQEVGQLPTMDELRLKRRRDPEFPSWNTFARLWNKTETIKKLGRRGSLLASPVCR